LFSGVGGSAGSSLAGKVSIKKPEKSKTGWGKGQK
jgi:hypothetical protein